VTDETLCLYERTQKANTQKPITDSPIINRTFDLSRVLHSAFLVYRGFWISALWLSVICFIPIYPFRCISVTDIRTAEYTDKIAVAGRATVVCDGVIYRWRKYQISDDLSPTDQKKSQCFCSKIGCKWYPT